MNWDAIDAVVEIIGELAVVTSLLYLATQIRTQLRELTTNLIDGYSALLEPQIWRDPTSTFRSILVCRRLGKGKNSNGVLVSIDM